MAELVKGIVEGDLPWTLIFIGVAIGLAVEIVGIPSLPFAIGLYLPISTSAPVILGGMIGYLFGRTGEPVLKKKRKEKGTLFCSGLIAGDAIIGIIVAALSVIVVGETIGAEPVKLIEKLQLREFISGPGGVESVFSVGAFVLLVSLLLLLLKKTR
jgi:uncharacterized oligopeptide transporter (OPT) family protein